MNKHDLIRKHGFRPGTREDFMAFAGAPADALFKHLDFELDPESGCVATYSESERAYHFYIFVDGENRIGKILEGNRLISLTCAMLFDEWAKLAEEAVGDRLLRLAGDGWIDDLRKTGFELI